MPQTTGEQNRLREGLGARRNVAVFEYELNGETHQVIRANEPQGLHAEEVIATYLREEGIPDDTVTAIYSERVPCSARGHECAVVVGRYDRADLSWSLSGTSTENASAILRYMRENGDL